MRNEINDLKISINKVEKQVNSYKELSQAEEMKRYSDRESVSEANELREQRRAIKKEASATRKTATQSATQSITQSKLLPLLSSTVAAVAFVAVVAPEIVAGTSINVEMFEVFADATSIYYELELSDFSPADDLSVVVYNDFTYREKEINDHFIYAEERDLKPNLTYTVEVRAGNSVLAYKTITTKEEAEPIEEEPIFTPIEIELIVEAVSDTALFFEVNAEPYLADGSLFVVIYNEDITREYPFAVNPFAQEVADLQPNTEYTVEVRQGETTLASQVVTTLEETATGFADVEPNEEFAEVRYFNVERTTSEDDGQGQNGAILYCEVEFEEYSPDDNLLVVLYNEEENIRKEYSIEEQFFVIEESELRFDLPYVIEVRQDETLLALRKIAPIRSETEQAGGMWARSFGVEKSEAVQEDERAVIFYSD
ncbi:MAG: hypothetical protein J6Z36_01895 [Clostridia bacterium]|nr:hypothetical protein [Clostridia bacterium]